MTKKAFLVTFEITTRVVTDVPDDFDPKDYNFMFEEHEEAFDTIVEKARDKILGYPQDYICRENTEVIEDTECPYDKEIDGD